MKILLACLALVAAARDADACKTLPPCEALAETQLADGLESKLGGADGWVVAHAAVSLARSPKPKQLAALGKALVQPATLAKLMKLDQGMRCVLPPILRALAANPDGRKVYLSLLAAPAWAEKPERNDGSDLPNVLLRSTAALAPMAPEVVALWKLRSQPADGWVNVTIQAVAESPTPEAAAFFDALLRDPAHRPEDKESWLHSSFIAYRERLPMLAMAHALLADDKLPHALHVAVIEGVFAYDQQWYGTCPGPAHVAYDAYAEASKAKLREIAVIARKRQPPKPLGEEITAALAKLVTTRSGATPP